MAAELRQRKKEASLGFQTKDLVEKWNSKRQHDLELLAKYFSCEEKAVDASLVEVDAFGFTLHYLENPHATTKKDVQVQFFKPITDRQKILIEMEKLLTEAKQALSLKPRKDYIAPGQEDHRTTLPDTTLAGVILTLWALVILGIYLPDHLLSPYFVQARLSFGGIDMLTNILRGIILIHSLEMLIAAGFLYHVGTPWSTILSWSLSIFLFGVFAWRPAMKAAFKKAGFGSQLSFT